MDDGFGSARGIRISPVGALRGSDGVYRDVNDISATL
jgi:hypothetical protein